MSDPFKITGPAVISFSGGRTSAYMLWRILQANGGLPDGVLVVFENTGKEREETLTFVERCSCEWGIPIVWLEYRYRGPTELAPDGTGKKRKRLGAHEFVRVDYCTASRNGEPFEMVIMARGMLPNVVMRFCTVELKIRTSQRFLKSLGWKHWTNCIGLRADEPHRVAKLRGSNRHENEDPIAPLATAGVTLADVTAFWKANSFDLQLESHEGNCDLCFLKGQGKLERIMRARPESAAWWAEMEERAEARGKTTNIAMSRFRANMPPYRELLKRSQRESLPMMGDDEPDLLDVACHCTD